MPQRDDESQTHGDDAATTLLHRWMPLTAAAGVIVTSATPARVELALPLEPNLNHQGTAFGGSVSVLGIVAGWLLVRTRAEAELEAGREPDGGLDVVIQSSTTRYIRPIDADASAVAAWGEPDDWPTVWPVFERAGRAQVAVRSEVHSGGRVRAVHDGVYVLHRVGP